MASNIIDSWKHSEQKQPKSIFIIEQFIFVYIFLFFSFLISLLELFC